MNVTIPDSRHPPSFSDVTGVQLSTSINRKFPQLESEHQHTFYTVFEIVVFVNTETLLFVMASHPVGFVVRSTTAKHEIGLLRLRNHPLTELLQQSLQSLSVQVFHELP